MRWVLAVMPLCLLLGCPSDPCDDCSDAGSDAHVPDAGSAPDGAATDAPVDAGTDAPEFDAGPLIPVSLSSRITRVQPMTGIVLWEDSWNGDPVKTSDAIQLEYAYVPPASIVTGADTYDWSSFDAFLDRIAGRGHQALVRFYYTYPGRETAVPEYIKALGDYEETRGSTEGRTTWFPDWRHAELQRAHLAFFRAFAARYDADPRVAFLQVGFGLWGEFHIYDGPREIGRTFPDRDFQRTFFQTLDEVLDALTWSVSIDAGSREYSSFAEDGDLRALRFGLFDDSFMQEGHDGYNADMWDVFGHEARVARAPHGGELSYYSDFDQRNVLRPEGIHGRTYESLSRTYGITYMIGNDQPNYRDTDRLREAGMANGYRLRVTEFMASDVAVRVGVTNEGIAPLYVDAWAEVDGVRAPDSLRGLLPGETRTSQWRASGARELRIACDRLVTGQSIEFAADL